MIFILILILVTITIYFIVKNVLIARHIIYFDESKIKYRLSENDKLFLNKYGKQTNIINTDGIFYTTTPWKCNNYCKYKNRYYIVEPGYYYIVNGDTEYNLQNAKCLFYEKK